MTKDEALRLALEALENFGNHDRVCPQWPTYAEPENYPKCNCGYDQSITAIKAALEAKDEPVDQPQVRTGNCLRVGVCASEGHKIQPQRTWVGLMDDDEIDWDGGDLKSFIAAVEAKLKEKNT